MAIKTSNDIICDSSSIISLTDSCLVNVLYFLSGKFKGKFIIPKGVEEECVRKPMGMKAHAMGAIIINKAIEDRILRLYEGDVQGEGGEIMQLANNSFFLGDKPLHLVDMGEAQMLAVAAKTGAKTMLMDERTTRMICEEPDALAKHLEAEFHRGVRIDAQALGEFSKLVGKPNFLRSTELVVVAYEKGFFRPFGKSEGIALEAALYSLKFSGASTGFEEIGDYVTKLGIEKI